MGGKLNVMTMIKQPVWRHNSNGRKFVIFIKHWVKAQIENLRSKISFCEVFLWPSTDLTIVHTFSL